jgi:4-hydroxybenzoate polyprenyltransferase
MLVRGLRLHHWLKNFLVFAPAILTRGVEADGLLTLFLAWLAFGCAASAQYLLNDFLDRNHDQQHVTKEKRPQVTGELPVRLAAGIMLALIAGATVCAAWLPAGSQVALASYLVLCLAYSLLLKRMLMIDVLTLVAVNDLRLVAGACAASIPLSPTLLLAGSFGFLAMALLKRDAQLTAVGDSPGLMAGRPYVRHHLPILRTLAATAIAASVLTAPLVLHEFAAEAARPQALWFVIPLLGAWLCRCFFLAVRRILNEDPVIFVCTDLFSLVTLAGAVLLLIVAG